jgi:nucleoside phosphorylase
MALIEREVGAAVAATAMAMSPRARKIVRQGAVYGLAGAIKAGDVVFSTARGAVRGAQQGVTGRPDGAAETSSAEPAAGAGASGAGESASAPRRTTRARTTRSADAGTTTEEA